MSKCLNISPFLNAERALGTSGAFSARKHSERRGNVNKQFYSSKRWRLKREQILKRDGYMCIVSKRYGRRVDADAVHHIYPVEKYPEYAFCNWNLISLSQKMHNKMHIRDTHELTAAGIALQKRTPLPPE